MAACTATVRKASDNSLAYARTAPAVGSSILGYLPDGVAGYDVLESKMDGSGARWHRLSFSGGSSGWVAGDRLFLSGDCLGSPNPTLSPTPAPTPTPTPTPTPSPTPTPTPTPTPVPTPTPPPTDTVSRVRAASFNITTGFEGATYDTYQNYDNGIVTYGRFGFTLEGGSLYSVLNRYLDTATGTVADQLRALYLTRIRERDASLRNDTTLKALLKAAASDPIMRAAQDDIAGELYWDVVQTLSIKPRGIVLPLSHAFLFDTAINSGPYHNMITTAEQFFGVPLKSKVGINGVSEPDMLSKVAEIRCDRLYTIADAQGLPGLKVRGDFWVSIMAAGDWNLQGDSNGIVLIKPGRPIQVKNP
jgi:hypothetical protein